MGLTCVEIRKLGVMLVVVTLSACSTSDGFRWGPAWSRHSAVPVNAAANPFPVNQSLPDFVSIVDKNGAAVVNITVMQQARAPRSLSTPRLDEGNPLSEFFRRFQGAVPKEQEDVPAFRMGSGFIVKADGYILTNAHVIANAKEVTVKLTDRREFDAKIIGSDRLSDVAVLKIDAHHLPVVKFGNPAEIKVAEWVVAIGSPFGFENSVTSGIVSAKSRSLPEETYVPFIQTDAAVNPGNSGGPLFNLKGEVIGMNSQIYSRSGGFQGLSFAIPIDIAANVMDQLIAHGKVTRGRLGIEIQDVTQALAESFGLAQTGGALVSNVEADSPAATAGIEAGDVIVKFDGKQINASAELPPLVSAANPGASAALAVWHRGSRLSIPVKIGALKEPSLQIVQ